MSKDSGSSAIWILALIAFGIYLLYLLIMWSAKVFVFLGYNSIFFLDNLFLISPFNPVAIWGIWGLFIGSIIGVFVAVKKFKLSKILILYPLAFVAMGTTIMGFVNAPTQYNWSYIPTPITNTVNPAPKIVQHAFYHLNSDANVRSGPSATSSKLFTLYKGNEVILIHSGFFDSRKIEWYKIKYNGQEGYISSKLLYFSRSGF